MEESEFCFHLLYILLSFCVIYPPVEFVSAGLTIDNLFKKYLRSEQQFFIQYHVQRTALTLFVHSQIPLIYIGIYYLKFWDGSDWNSDWKLNFWYAISFLAILLPILCLLIIWSWSANNWEGHPISQRIKKFTNNNSRWETLAETINLEYVQTDKMLIKINTIFTVVITENWIMKATPYTVHFAHKSDTALIADKTDSHIIGQNTTESVQFVNIQVKPTRTGVTHFTIRINALDFRELQDRMARPITVLSSVQFHQTILDRWIEVFKEQVELNPRYRINENLETCFACMVAEPNIKLQKNCADENEHGEMVPLTDRCGNCYCRPMWCSDCMAKWFASRQSQYAKDVWLQMKCTCPMCRAPFCILDICYIVKDT